MSLPRYPNYKDSGVEWLGEVPEHWCAVPIKHLGRLKGGAGFPHESQGIEGEELSFHKVNALAQADRAGVLQPSDNTISRDTAKRLGAFIFPPKTIVFAKVGAALLLGRIRLLNHDACIDNNMMGLIVHSNKFYVPFVRHAMNLVRFDLIANPGAVPSLNEGQIGDFQLAAPPLPEQTQIAAFLDRETAKIDELVAEQRRLMALLREKRQAIISHAVTRGLNPDAPMKPSGIAWLGDVPAHWEVMALKRDLEFLTSGSRGWADNYSDEGDLFIRIANLTRDSIDLDLSDVQRVAVPGGAEGSRTKVRTGDVLFSITAYLGSVAVVPDALETAYVSQHVSLARLRQSRIEPRWVGFVTLSIVGKTWFETQSYGGTKIQLSLDDVRNLPIPVPPISEQQSIVAYIEDELARFDTLATEAQRAIALLQERRTALISAAVTGQIDVSGAVPA